MSWDTPFAYFYLTAWLRRRAELVLKAGTLFTRGDCVQDHMPRLILRLFYWKLLAGQFEFLRSGLSAGFPSGGCLWKYWQEWEGVITSVDIWGSALGNLSPVSPLGGKGAGEWGVYPLTSPLPPSLAESCSPGRQTDNFQALVCPSKG